MTASGEFTVASALELIRDSQENTVPVNWKKIWQWRGPERIKSFLWLAVHGRLPTKSLCYQRKVVADSLCPMCQLHDETARLSFSKTGVEQF